jgi:hypothetical protein
MAKVKYFLRNVRFLLNTILLFSKMRIHRQMPIVVRTAVQVVAPRRARQQEQQFHFRLTNL